MTTNKTIFVITGGTSGMGLHLVKKLEKNENNYIVVLARSEEKFNDYFKDSVNVIFEFVDLRDLESVKNCCINIKNRCQQIDYLFCNAGMLSSKGKMNNPKEINRCYGVNYISHYLLTMNLIDLIKKCEGTVINTGSILHQLGSENFESDIFNLDDSYASSKLALSIFTYVLQTKYDINAILVSPGYVDTGLWKVNSNKLWVKIMHPINKLLLKVFSTSSEEASDVLYYAMNIEEQTYNKKINYISSYKQSVLFKLFTMLNEKFYPIEEVLSKIIYFYQENTGYLTEVSHKCYNQENIDNLINISDKIISPFLDEFEIL